MPSIARLYDFQAGTVISSSQVDAEFDQLIATVNALPDKDGSLQTDLNADMVDGFHASESGGDGTIPVCNGDLQVALNAEFVGGLAASDIADAGFPSGTTLIFADPAVPAGWTEKARPAIDRVIGWGKTAGGSTDNGNTDRWLDIVNHLSVVANSHALSIAEIPAHTHTLSMYDSGGANNLPLAATASLTGLGAFATSSTGSGAGHTHTCTVSGVASPSTWRPPIIWTILGVKD